MGHHDHDHHEHHHHESPRELSFNQKLEKLFDHWIRHNEDHAATYRQWADRCREAQLDEVAECLEQVAEMNIKINGHMAAARKLVPED